MVLRGEDRALFVTSNRYITVKKTLG